MGLRLTQSLKNYYRNLPNEAKGPLSAASTSKAAAFLRVGTLRVEFLEAISPEEVGLIFGSIFFLSFKERVSTLHYTQKSHETARKWKVFGVCPLAVENSVLVAFPESFFSSDPFGLGNIPSHKIPSRCLFHTIPCNPGMSPWTWLHALKLSQLLAESIAARSSFVVSPKWYLLDIAKDVLD